MNARRIAGAWIVCLLLASLASGCAMPERWAWKLADLDRNRLNLGLFRGADTGPALAEWVENGTVVAIDGSAPISEDGSVALLVRYERAATGWLSSSSGVEVVCYRFTTQGAEEVAFSRARC